MSNVGQAALTIVGTVVGYFAGYPALGFYLGSLAGNVLFPTELPGQKGPRLLDLTVQTSTIGTPIPQVYGTYAIAGNIIWSSGLIETETTEEVGGKGGPTQEVTTYSYRVNVAIGLCEGPISGIRRVWADSKLIFDISRPPEAEGVDLEDLPGGLFNNLLAQIAASSVTQQGQTLYLGTETQLPDPTIEAFEGIGNVPAYRGLAYLVLTDFQLADYGNRIPNFRVEVVKAGATECVEVVEYSNQVLYPWISADFPVNPDNSHEFYWRDGWGSWGGFPINTPFTTLEAALSAASARANKGFPVYSGYRTIRGDDAGVVNRIGGRTVDTTDTVSVWLHYSSEVYVAQVPLVTGDLSLDLADYATPAGTKVWSNNAFTRSNWAGGGGVYMSLLHTNTQPIPPGFDTVISGNPYWALAADVLIECRRVPQPPPDPCAASGLFGSDEFCALPDGTVTASVPWTRIDLPPGQSARVLQRYSVGQVSGFPGRTFVLKYPLGPVRPVGHAEYSDQAFWEAAYQAAVARGDMPAGLVYNLDYPELQNFYYTRSYEVCVLDPDAVTLASIVEDQCTRVGLTDVDVSDLEDVPVHGYVIGRTMSARDAIEATRPYGYFDSVESDGLVKFVKRGHPAVATIPELDLGAYDANGERPSAVTVTRRLDFEIPRVVRVHYAMPEQNYEAGEQYSSRLAGESVDTLDLQIAMAMSDDKAKQISEVLLYDAWTARNSYAITLDQRYLRLEPTDCILVPVEGQFERMRILSITYTMPSLLDLELVRDDDGVYVSQAVGNANAGQGSVITFTGPTLMVLLDLPALRDADDDAGYYAALRPMIATAAWTGAAIFRSTDNGASYSMIGSGTGSPATGELIAALPSGPSTIFDGSNTLRVRLYNGTLESRTEEALLNGANAAAIGADGRWEIVQFQNAELIGDTWHLTGLLRGRRGTEHAIGSSLAGDSFVLLSGGGLVRLPLESAAIGAPTVLKVVTFGASILDDETTYPFTGRGVALKPFSPVFVEAVREDDDDIRISWIRRGRLSQELRDGADIPLSEASERYEVDIIDPDTDAVLRTLAVTQQQATYTAAQQAEDFESSTPTAIELCVYQLSDVVGRGYGECTTVPIVAEEPVGGSNLFDDDAVIFTGEGAEADVNGLLTWIRQGSGPRLSAGGFVGDGYEARYAAAVAGGPSWLASSSGPVTLRASIEPYFGAKHATADRAVSLCVNDATANARLELVVVDDATAAGEPQVAARAYTGSIQTQRLCRRNWRFEFTFPQKLAGADEARPLGVAFTPSGVLVAAHYEGASSSAFACDEVTGEVNGAFGFGASYLEVHSIAVRGDGTYWAADHASGTLIRFGLDASLAAGEAQVDLTFDLLGPGVLGAIAWATVDEVEYLLALEHRTTGTPYLYVLDAALVVNAGTFDTGDRLTRIEVPTFARGIAIDPDGRLWLSVAAAASDGVLYRLDLDSIINATSDGDSYTAFLIGSLVGPTVGPTQMLGDLAFDPSGRLWCPTEGEAAAGDDDAFLALWSSGLGYAEPNTYQLRYDGAGAVTITVNDKLFATKAWTPTPTPGVVSIGGPPAATAGQANGFVSGRVRNVVLQESDLALFDPFGNGVVYGGTPPQAWPLPLANPGAEESTDGWVVEEGSLSIGPATIGPDAKFGEHYFIGESTDEGSVVESACGGINLVSGVGTIPALPNGQAGDVQLLFLVFNTNGTPTFPTPDDDGWRPIYVRGPGLPSYFNNSLTAIGFQNIAAYWRVLTGAASTFVITQPSGSIPVSYAQLLLRGIDADNFLYGIFNGGNKTNSTRSRHTINPAYGVPANDGDLVTIHSNHAALVAADVLPEEGDSVVLACRHTQTSGSLEANSAVVVSRHEPLANNLLLYSETLDPAAWSFENVTRTTQVQTTTRRENVRLTHANTSTGRFRAYTTVDLVAGEVYSFLLQYRLDTAGVEPAVTITYVKPSDSSEHGLAFVSSGAGSTAIGSEVSVENGSFHSSFGTGSGATCYAIEMRFVAPETGTYTLNISMPRTTDPTNLDATVGQATCFFGFNGLSLARLPSLYHTSPYVATDAMAVEEGDSDFLMPVAFRHPSNNDTLIGTVIGLLWKNQSVTKPLCKLCDLGVQRFTHHDDLSLITTRVLQAQAAGADYLVELFASHCVHRYMAAGQKFYAEYEVDAVGTGALSAGLAVHCGALPRAFPQPTGTQAGVTLGNQAGSYSYAMNGTTTLNGSSEGVTSTALDTGDFLGVGIDLENGEINWYVNGVLERTQTIADQTYQLKMPWTISAGVQSGDEQASNTLFTMNFRGPFGGRKPSGYVAFDHDNELT